MSEEMAPQPEDPYGIAKYAVELDLHAAHEMFGLDSVVFRPHNVYGEHQNIGDRYRNVIGIFMNQIMSGEPLTVFGDGTQTRAFSHIDDVAPYIAVSATMPAAFNQTINIGADTPHSVNHLADVVCRAFGVEPNVRRLPSRNEVVDAYATHDKARRIFGERGAHPVPLEEGIARMAAWARRVGARQSSTFEHLELEKGLPGTWKR
jgi:UDP-glucose 4-epimerase